MAAPRWPFAIALVLGVFVTVQLAFAWVAVRSPDPVVPTYATEAR